MLSGGATSEDELMACLLGQVDTQMKKCAHDLQNPKRKRVIVIAGPTAAGKTDLSLMLAKEINGEVVSADSMQVYEGMDVGTAKVSMEDRLKVPHHLIDLCDISTEFTVVDYYHSAKRACNEIIARGGVPIVVGGSGFYIHSLIYGPPATPPSVPGVREALEKEMELTGPEQMYSRLKEQDPKYAESITIGDRQKIVRALEIISVGGKKVSDIHWGSRHQPRDFEFLCWFLHRPKPALYERIDHRCEEMLQLGLLEEVGALLENGLLENRSACQAIGYRQVLDYLKGGKSQPDYDKMVEDFKRVSRKYAKRQFTWFKKEQLFKWVDIDQHDPELIMDLIVKDFESRR